MIKVKKAIIPAAGFGTRFLPITKAVPKEMLPVLDKPSIDFAIEECIQSGITDICIVVSRGKEAIVNYLDRAPELEDALNKANKREQLAVINKFSKRAKFIFLRQSEMRGTGKAIELCRGFTDGEPFAVLFPDDIIYNPAIAVTAQLVSAYETTGTSIVGVQNMRAEQAINYGVMVPAESKGRYVRIKGFKEKPTLADIPSTLTSLGRFVLTPDIFDYIERTKPVANGEVYLPNSIDLMAKEGLVYAYNFEGTHYDMGSKFGFLQANIDFALRDKELAAELKAYILDKNNK